MAKRSPKRRRDSPRKVKRVLSAEVPPDVYDAFRTYAESHWVSISSLVRYACEAYRKELL